MVARQEGVAQGVRRGNRLLTARATMQISVRIVDRLDYQREGLHQRPVSFESSSFPLALQTEAAITKPDAFFEFSHVRSSVTTTR